jgi:hypothetical protein
MLAWEKLPTKGVPLFFYGVRGIDMAELDSPSYFNLVVRKIRQDQKTPP